MKPKKVLGYLAALGYAAIIGFSFIFVKGILNYADVIDVLMFRFALAFIPLLILYPLRRKQCTFTWKRVKVLLFLGLFYPLIFFGMQTVALSVSSSIEISAVQATAPVFTLILAAVILKEHTNLLQKFSVLLCVGGVVYIVVMKFLKNTSPRMEGLAIALISTLAFAIYTVLAKKHKKNYTNYEMLFVTVGSGFSYLLVISLIKNTAMGTLNQLFTPWTNAEFSVGLIYLSILSTLISGFLINFALANIDASKMVVFNNLGTVIQILAGVIILSETLFPSHIVGSIMIILGLLGVNLLGQVDDVKNYVPIFWVIGSVVSFITAIFTFFMGSQNMSYYYLDMDTLRTLSLADSNLASVGSNYAISFYVITMIFTLVGIGFAILYYLSSKRLAAIKRNEMEGRISYPQYPKDATSGH
ncbi:MAG: DMT family transporter [Eubacteriales bacterium]|nr:DMT family transporter [Eubacteriales bacterium]